MHQRWLVGNERGWARKAGAAAKTFGVPAPVSFLAANKWLGELRVVMWRLLGAVASGGAVRRGALHGEREAE